MMGRAGIQLVAVEAVRPYPYNARTHSDEQVGQIAGSIDEFGMVGAIVVRDGVVAKGHGTLAAVMKLYAAGKRIYPPPGRKMGGEPFPDGTVPVLDASGWSDSQFRAYVLADNKLAENAGWDALMLKVELLDLKDEGFDLGLVGFSDEELAELLKEGGAGEGGDGDDDGKEYCLTIVSNDEAEIIALRRIFALKKTAAKVEAGLVLAALPV